ncbi:MAG: threonine synthase, partial [bacterium]
MPPRPFGMIGYRCLSCEKEFSGTAPRYICAQCGGNLDVVYDYKRLGGRFSRKKLAASTDHSAYRYRALFPLASQTPLPALRIGGTPLYPLPSLGRELGAGQLYLKDDTRNPSASLKDRAGFMVLAKAIEIGKDVVAGASTGNAASSLARLASSMGRRVVIFVPHKAPPAKIAQLLVFGARVHLVRGSYDDAYDLCIQACEAFGWYNRNTGYNPFTREGKKTCAYEICEQLQWQAPDKVFVPAGDGNILSGLWKGFVDLYELNMTDKLPQMIAVQSDRSAAIARAAADDGVIRPVHARTIADSISVDLPRDGMAAVKAIRASHGEAVTVSDRDILAAIGELGKTTGVFAEPAAAAAYAGLKRYAAKNRIQGREKVVMIITGNGLKDIGSAMK